MASVNDILTRARSKIGVTEHPRGSNCQEFGQRFGFNCIQWCSVFVADTYAANGIDLKRIVAPGYAACATALAGYQRLGWVLRDKREAQPADIVFFDFPGDGSNVTHHTGIVESNQGGRGLITIEGNTSGGGSQTNGGAVLRKERSWGLVKAVARVRILDGSPSPIPWPAPNPTPPPSPTPTTPINNEDDMRIFKVFGGQHWACFANRERRKITEDHANKLRWYGIPFAVVEDQGASWVILAHWNIEIPAV